MILGRVIALSSPPMGYDKPLYSLGMGIEKIGRCADSSVSILPSVSGFGWRKSGDRARNPAVMLSPNAMMTDMSSGLLHDQLHTHKGADL